MNALFLSLQTIICVYSLNMTYHPFYIICYLFLRLTYYVVLARYKLPITKPLLQHPLRRGVLAYGVDQSRLSVGDVVDRVHVLHSACGQRSSRV